MVREKNREGVVSAQEVGFDGNAYRNVSSSSFALAIRVLLQNWRQGTVGCKTRSEVNKTGKKPWKQKGTGRARAGTARSPLWRGGGIVFGPQPRTRTLKVSKKVNRQILGKLAWERFEQQCVVSLPIQWQDEKPKTALAQSVLNNAGLAGKRIALFVTPGDFRAYASFINMPNVHVLFFDQPNVYDLVSCQYWAFLEHDRDQFKEMVGAWS